MDPMFEFWFFKETNLYLYWSCSYILYHWSETNYKEKPIPGRKTLRLVKAWNACNMHPAWRILAFESQEPSDRFVPALHDLGMTSLWPLIGHFQFSRYHKSWFNFLDTRRDDFDGRTGLLTTSKKKTYHLNNYDDIWFIIYESFCQSSNEELSSPCFSCITEHLCLL